MCMNFFLNFHSFILSFGNLNKLFAQKIKIETKNHALDQAVFLGFFKKCKHPNKLLQRKIHPNPQRDFLMGQFI